MITSELSLHDLFSVCQTRLEKVFSHYLAGISSSELKSAMEYSFLNGGKRLRPLLIYATGCIFDADFANLDAPACCVELIHSYSLIHDDLPCMDNADLRRGKPSNHKVYGEGIAVLTGDALHTLAIQVLASHSMTLKAEQRIKMMQVISKACGPFGMAAGQALDITVMNTETISLDLLTDIYRLKTGALLSACVELGRLGAADDDENNEKALSTFGDQIGLAFQIQDDILDMESTTEDLGKPQDIDSKNNKITYPKLCGLQKAKDKVQTLYQEALTSIDYLGHRAQLLRDLTSLILERKS